MAQNFLYLDWTIFHVYIHIYDIFKSLQCPLCHYKSPTLVSIFSNEIMSPKAKIPLSFYCVASRSRGIVHLKKQEWCYQIPLGATLYRLYIYHILTFTVHFISYDLVGCFWAWKPKYCNIYKFKRISSLLLAISTCERFHRNALFSECKIDLPYFWSCFKKIVLHFCWGYAG